MNTMNHPGGTNSAYVTRASMLERLKAPVSKDRDMAWEQFRARYAPIIASFAGKCSARPHDIDDIIQDVMTSFFSVSGEFVYDPSKGRFRSYLKTCTIRACVKRAGKQMQFRGRSLDEIPQIELAVEPVWDDVWEQQLVAQALKVLKDECEDALSFKAFEQYVLKDRPAEIVAAELKTSVNNVHQAKTRMTHRLRQIVARIRESED